MELNLSPRAADVTVAKTDGGAYYVWSGTDYPVLSKAKLGAGKLVLHPRGFTLPHFSDCDKIGFVAQGSFRVGVVRPNSVKENVVIVNKGDVIPVLHGELTWWYNAENTVAEIVFLGETTKTYSSASQFDYYFLSGKLGILRGFSTDFITQTFDLDNKQSEKLVESQAGGLIVRLPEGTNLPDPNINRGDITACSRNLESAKPDICVNRGGSIVIADAEINVDADAVGVGELGLKACLVKLEENSMLGPINSAVDSATQMFYVLEGSGRVQISGLNGKNALDAKLKKGHLFVVPRFFSSAIMADAEGLQCFLLLTSVSRIHLFTQSNPEASFLKFSGDKSVWNALSSSVLQAALNVDSDFVELFKTKIGNGNIISPPPKQSIYEKLL